MLFKAVFSTVGSTDQFFFGAEFHRCYDAADRCPDSYSGSCRSAVVTFSAFIKMGGSEHGGFTVVYQLKFRSESHRIHGAGIFIYMWVIEMGQMLVNIPYMDPMGIEPKKKTGHQWRLIVWFGLTRD